MPPVVYLIKNNSLYVQQNILGIFAIFLKLLFAIMFLCLRELKNF